MSAGTTTLPRPTGANAKFDHILDCATRVFCEKGYEGASIRTIARRSSVSLAGLYYYVHSKEQLLYLIQKQSFATLLDLWQQRLQQAGPDPEQRLRLFVRNHIGYFLAHPEAMKVLSHESESLKPPYAGEVADLKRAYYRQCRNVLEDLKRARKLRNLNTRVAVLSLFGMMNWIYTWYNPRVDPEADMLAGQMADLFLRGLQNTDAGRRPVRSRNSRERRAAA